MTVQKVENTFKIITIKTDHDKNDVYTNNDFKTNY